MLSNVDLTKMAPSQREQMIKSVAQPMQEAAAGGQASPAGLKQMGDLATTMGVAQ
jgi:hypothetical protein